MMYPCCYMDKLLEDVENMTSVTEKMNLTPFENRATTVAQMCRSRKELSNDVSIFVFIKSQSFSGLGTETSSRVNIEII